MPPKRRSLLESGTSLSRISSLSGLHALITLACHRVEFGISHRAVDLESNLRFTAADARAYSSFLCTSPSAFATEAFQSADGWWMVRTEGTCQLRHRASHGCAARSRQPIDFCKKSMKLPTPEIWFVTGSQHLYGPGPLKQVAANSQQVVDGLNGSKRMGCPLSSNRSSPGLRRSDRSANRQAAKLTAPVSSFGCIRSRPRRCGLAG